MTPQATPVDPPLTPGQLARLHDLIAQHRATPGALLPLLHAVQEALGHVPPAAVPLMAQALNLSRAEVHGVVSYYHFFRSTPAGRVVVQLCQAEACQACGSPALTAAAERMLGCALGSTRADGEVTLAPVYCLGLCAQSPAAAVAPAGQAERRHVRLTPARLHALAVSLGVAVAGAEAQGVAP